jgi:hypothetical protein
MTLPQLILNHKHNLEIQEYVQNKKGHQALSIISISKNGFAGNQQVVF